MKKSKRTIKKKVKGNEDTTPHVENGKVTELKHWNTSKGFLKKFSKNKENNILNVNLKEKLLTSSSKLTTYLVTMFYPSGNSRFFLISTDNNKFHIGDDHCYYMFHKYAVNNVNQGMKHFVYHFDEAIPMNMLKPIKHVDKNSPNAEYFLMINAMNSESVIDQNHVKVLAQANDINKMFVISCVLAGVSLLLGIINIIAIVFTAVNVSQLGKLIGGG
ncbi:MAG: hypothetical protein R6U15_03730 [Candidatus Izemoplasmatales bacterium]